VQADVGKSRIGPLMGFAKGIEQDLAAVTCKFRLSSGSSALFVKSIN